MIPQSAQRLIWDWSSGLLRLPIAESKRFESLNFGFISARLGATWLQNDVDHFTNRIKGTLSSITKGLGQEFRA
jgi:hypothetical protein